MGTDPPRTRLLGLGGACESCPPKQSFPQKPRQGGQGRARLPKPRSKPSSTKHVEAFGADSAVPRLGLGRSFELTNQKSTFCTCVR